MEYIHTVLMVKQPEIYLDTIFYHNGVQIELTWRHVCYGTINLHNTIDFLKMVTFCKAVFDTIVAEYCTFGTHPYAHMFI